MKPKPPEKSHRVEFYREGNQIEVLMTMAYVTVHEDGTTTTTTFDGQPMDLSKIIAEGRAEIVATKRKRAARPKLTIVKPRK